MFCHCKCLGRDRLVQSAESHRLYFDRFRCRGTETNALGARKPHDGVPKSTACLGPRKEGEDLAKLKDVREEGLQDLLGSEGMVLCRAGAVHLVLEGSSHDTFNDAVMLVALRFRSAMNYVRSFKKVRLVETLM